LGQVVRFPATIPECLVCLNSYAPTTGSGAPRASAKQNQFYSGGFVDKAESGHVGLRNQGATCYLNSLFQTLFLTPVFRKAVFQWKHDQKKHGQEAEGMMAYQLQKLFAALLTGARGAVSTEGVTKSFGWTGSHVYVQHDVQELFQILLESLEEQYAGEPLAQTLRERYFGSYEDYVECVTCGHRRSKEVAYLNVQLEVRGTQTVRGAFEKFTNPEVLSGDNAVNCDACKAKQPAHKGLRFTALPDVLSLQLCRFDMDWATMQRVKLGDTFAFPERLDLTDFLRPTGGKAGEGAGKGGKEGEAQKGCEFELYSVLIHTGGARGGHYFAYIKDLAIGRWCPPYPFSTHHPSSICTLLLRATPPHSSLVRLGLSSTIPQ